MIADATESRDVWSSVSTVAVATRLPISAVGGSAFGYGRRWAAAADNGRQRRGGFLQDFGVGGYNRNPFALQPLLLPTNGVLGAEAPCG